MVETPLDDHGIVAHLRSIFQSPSSVDEKIRRLHEMIAVRCECIDEQCDSLRNYLEVTKKRLQRRVARKDDCESIHDLEPSFKEWLELENVFHNWALLYEGLPDWEDAYDAEQIAVIEEEEVLFDVSEQLRSYKETLEEMETFLGGIERRLNSLEKELKQGLNWKVGIEGVRHDLNEQITKLVNLEQAAQTIESETLENSKALAKKVIQEHDVLEHAPFSNFNDTSDNFRYYLLDEDDDFYLLTYWIFHDEIAGFTLKPRKKTRYKSHTDSSCPVEHVNLYVEDDNETYLIHVIPYEHRSEWIELVES